MTKVIDLLDSANQKFDPGASGMTADNAQDGIIEAYNNGGGAGTFVALTDTPSDYVGQSGKYVTVGVDQLVFTDPPSGAGEANRGENLDGSGAEVYAGMNGVNLTFREFTAGSTKITVTQNVNALSFDVDEAQFAHMQIVAGNPHGTTAADVGAEPADATILKQADVDDTPVNGATTDPISSNWAFDHNADPKHMPAAGAVSQYIRKQSGTDYDVLWENLRITDDPTPVLGGDLDLDGYNILLTNPTDGVEGAIGLAANNTDVFFGHVNADLIYNPADGGILCQPGKLTLGGSVVEVPVFKSAENQDVQVSPEGILFAAPLPHPGWEAPATSTYDHDFGNDKTQGPWVAVTGLTVNPGDNITTGDRVDAYANLYIENTEDKTGAIEIGIGINGADPTAIGINKSVGPDSISYIPVAWIFIAVADYTTADTFTIFARRAASVDDAHLYLRGTAQSHSMLLSIPGEGGGGGGSPTNLGNIPAASTVTITSSTGSNTVLAGAVSGTAGVMTGAQVDALAGKADLANANSFTDANEFLGDFNVGDPGSEISSIQIDGISYPSIGKFNRFGTGVAAELVIHRHSTVDNSNLVFSRALSNDATHANVANGTVLGDIQFTGWGDSSYWSGAAVKAVVDGTPGVSDMPTKLDFLTSADGSFTPTLRMSVRADGVVEIVGDMSVGGVAITAAKINTWDNAIPEPPNNTYGYVREGSASNQWVRGSRVFVQATDPVASAADGDIWIPT